MLCNTVNISTAVYNLPGVNAYNFSFRKHLLYLSDGKSIMLVIVLRKNNASI